MYIHEYMTRKVVTISPASQITEAMKIMRHCGIRRLPVEVRAH